MNFVSFRIFNRQANTFIWSFPVLLSDCSFEGVSSYIQKHLENVPEEQLSDFINEDIDVYLIGYFNNRVDNPISGGQPVLIGNSVDLFNYVHEQEKFEQEVLFNEDKTSL